MGTQSIKSAFLWIEKLLRKHKIPFQVTGGLAASVYGSERGYRDIDILIRPNVLPKVLPLINKYIVFGPGRYKDDNFNSYMIELKIRGVKIDIGIDCKIKNNRARKWYQTPGPTRFSYREIFGKRVKVEAKDKLIKIKRILGREKDLEDVAAMMRKIKRAA
ncbi:MAG: hypothetical protein HY471_02800 [Candidatus Sungbacteria bacterium]|nr:hypothetical protein [Candidatus Sungbacteria bacterium]